MMMNRFGPKPEAIPYGNKIWALLIESFSHHNRHSRYVVCLCDCGNRKIIAYSNIKRGSSKSCGCLHASRIGALNRVHGMTRTKVYRAWKHLRERINNPNCKKYSLYGGRGISLCERWNKFENFIEDMGQPPTSFHSIDRINVNGNYEPGNCRWATAKEQARNKRNSILIDINGQIRPLKEWCDLLGKDYKLVWAHIRQQGKSIEQALRIRNE